MTIQLSTGVRDARLDAIETAIGTSAILKVFTGSQPANCATADSGTLLSTMTLPSDWMAGSSGGTKSKSGTWQQLSASGTGTPGYFRIYNSAGTTCHIQGSAAVGSGDLNCDGTFTAGQTVTVNSFSLTDANS